MNIKHNGRSYVARAEKNHSGERILFLSKPGSTGDVVRHMRQGETIRAAAVREIDDLATVARSVGAPIW